MRWRSTGISTSSSSTTNQEHQQQSTQHDDQTTSSSVTAAKPANKTSNADGISIITSNSIPVNSLHHDSDNTTSSMSMSMATAVASTSSTSRQELHQQSQLPISSDNMSLPQLMDENMNGSSSSSSSSVDHSHSSSSSIRTSINNSIRNNNHKNRNKKSRNSISNTFNVNNPLSSSSSAVADAATSVAADAAMNIKDSKASSAAASDSVFHVHEDQDADDDDDDDDDDDYDDDDDDDLDDDDDFDPGQDHAMPEDGIHTIWKPQNQQSTCEFTHTITNYASKRESGCKKAEYSSTTVDSFGNRWRLIVYVNGNGRASNHHLSLFLQVADADDLPFGWKKGVSYVLTLEHPSGPTLGYAKRNPDKTFKLCPKAIDWGWSQFITSDRVQQEGYISNDSLTVRASVTVKSSSISIDPDDAELYLKCAVEEGNADAVEACLVQGACVNCQFKDDLYTPLHTACSSSTNDGSLEVLKLLLKRGANGNACNKWKETPLLIAANNGHRAAVEALLEHGADPSMCSEAGWSALTFAAHKGYNDIVSLLLAAGAPVNCRVIEDFSTPLHKACAGGKPGHLSAVKQLIAGNADVHSLNKWRETPLLTAANHGQAAAVEALLDAGGDPCKCTDTGWSPLSIAAYKGHDDVVRLLLEQGAPTEEADPTLSALLQAATKGLPDTVELLLRHGADHTVTTKKGDTALSILVEQNLIDAAVEMVTEYKASVPRCSRDRKKVQRARLLINLRVKQQQREGLLNDDTDSDEDCDHDDSDDGSRSALHDSDSSPKAFACDSSSKSKKKKKKSQSRESAEAQAKAAELALLHELEQEDAKAQKDEAAANSKRNKKKKKKEKGRQQKLEEEKLRKQKEQKESDERERQRLLREKKEKKEREAKAREKQEKEMIIAAERERIAAKRREKEEKERKKREQEKKEQMKKEQVKKELEKRDKKPQVEVKGAAASVVPKNTPSNTSQQNNSNTKSNTEKSFSIDLSMQAYNQKQNNTTKSTGNKNSSKRGWETKTVKVHNKTNEASDIQGSSIPYQSSVPPSSEKSGDSVQATSKASVEDQLENMANSVVDFLVVDPAPKISYDSAPGSSGTEVSSESTDQQMSWNETPGSIAMDSSMNQSQSKSFAIETAALSQFRYDKVTSFLSHATLTSPSCRALAHIDIHTIRVIVYKWVVRAAYDSAPCLDPVIPSWENFDMLVEFCQRQIISESRRASSALAGNYEVMKEAGSSLAELCYNTAKEVIEFSKRYGEKLPPLKNDSTLNMSASEKNNIITIDWAGRSQVFLPVSSYMKLRNRYHGPLHLFLTAIFSMVKRYETLDLILNGTSIDYNLSSSLLNTLATEIKVNIELLSNPLSVLGSNNFSGFFSDVDVLFGGSQPFSEDGNDMEALLTTKGGSAACVPPLDSNTASMFMKRITNILEVTEGKGIPLSVMVFLPMQCFRDLKTAPTPENLSLLEPRLLSTHKIFIRHIESLPMGRYRYSGTFSDDRICQTDSMLIFLQNDCGRMHFSLSTQAIGNIIRSMLVSGMPGSASPLIQFQPKRQQPAESISTSPSKINYIPTDSSTSPPTVSNNNALQNQNSGQVTTSVKNFPNNFERKVPRRGRYFDLVDDGDDDPTPEVSGMLNNLNKSLFQNDSSHDVDIEAIGLGFLNIDNPGSMEESSNSLQSNRFS